MSCAYARGVIIFAMVVAVIAFAIQCMIGAPEGSFLYNLGNFLYGPWNILLVILGLLIFALVVFFVVMFFYTKCREPRALCEEKEEK